MQYVFEKCEGVKREKGSGRDYKRICNNLVISFDDKKNQTFGRYKIESGNAHDAGYDAYMTGYTFATTSKYIEIGELIKPISNQK